MATNSVARAEAAGSVYPVAKKTSPAPGNEAPGPTGAEAASAGSTGRVVDNYTKGPAEAGATGKGGKVNARA